MEALISFFVKYLLVPLLAVVMLFVVNKLAGIKKKIQVKKVIIFVLIVVLILTLPSLFALLKNEFVWGGLVLSIISYLILGIGLVYYVKSSYYAKTLGFEDDLQDKAIFFLVLCIAMLVSGWAYYLFFNLLSTLPYASTAMFIVLWFVMPLLYVIARDYYLKFAPVFRTPWVVKSDATDSSYWERVDTFNLIQVTVRIKKTPDAENYSSYVVKLPMEVPIGKWFDRFIEDQNVRFPESPILTKDEDEDIGWVFYTPKWFTIPLFVRFLDPENEAYDNRIKNRQIIYIRRVKLEKGI
ncbi:TssN family type VI secretion system protein [Capnocytophaga sp. oral taxon 878]|jgi:hypothetical protein|uniref:TssN family type VI secretion system protein n=1 Tax=Capnocytophaga sp. oral taxon 878 TaxID=1316596 RepID=UPI000D029FC4|nr:TssN family type VI secretion system protein [Capnocytophaga sp. oral taxon 878]AVM50206.1 hypothetical protein C4H12_06850 [Capnocytophaga sp. oral taxon 878]